MTGTKIPNFQSFPQLWIDVVDFKMLILNFLGLSASRIEK